MTMISRAYDVTFNIRCYNTSNVKENGSNESSQRDTDGNVAYQGQNKSISWNSEVTWLGIIKDYRFSYTNRNKNIFYFLTGSDNNK